jgi:Peptidase inhibitor family I36
MRRIIVLAAAAAAIAGVAAAPANAAPSPEHAREAVHRFDESNCRAPYLCLYRDAEFTGGGLAIEPGASIPSLADYGFSREMSSWSNETDDMCFWSDDEDLRGVAHMMDNGVRVNMLDEEDDTAMSVTCSDEAKISDSRR